jgi:uncharacterized lipoprotein YmbA
MKITALFLAILLVGCASRPIPPTYYLMRSNQDLTSSKLSTSKQFSLGTLEIAAYLDQPGLAMEIAAGEMRPASQNLWAEPIHDGVRNFLSTEIAQASGQELLPTKLTQNTTVVNIRIDQLHGTSDGRAVIVAYWWLVSGDEVMNLQRFSDSRGLAKSGYAALVEAQKVLLSELAQRIAATMSGSSALSTKE